MRVPAKSFTACLLVLLTCLSLTTVINGATQRVTILLENALTQGGETAEAGRDLYLQTTLDDGEFDWLLGSAPDFNKGMHRGRVTSGSLAKGELNIEVAVQGDPWISGGRAQYKLSIQRDENGQYQGQYAGTFQQIPERGAALVVHAVKGTVQIELNEPMSTQPGYKKPEQGEHPRMLLRESDVDTLKKRATTPLGKALADRLKASDDIVAMGLAYQITGDRAYAFKAMAPVRQKMADESPGAFNGSDGAYAKRVGEVAKTYDLCYDAWPEDFRDQVTDYLARRAETMLFRPHSVTRKTNWAPNSNYMGHFSGAGALAGLAIYDKQGPKPTPPVDPGNQPLVIQPVEVKQLDKAYVNSFEYDVMPLRWLYLGPIANERDDPTDFLQKLGGQALAQPKVGSKVNLAGKNYAFEDRGNAILWDEESGNRARQSLELMRSTGKQYHTTSYYYAVIDVTNEVTTQFRYKAGGGFAARFWLSGQPIYEGDVVTLKPGKHTLMCRAQFYKINPWGKAWLRPRFNQVDQEKIKRGIESLKVQYELDLAEYQEDLAYWEQNNQASAYYRWLMLCGVMRATNYHRYCFGDGGFQVEGEGYTSVGADLPLLFETAYLNTFGHPSTGRPDVSHFGPRYVAQTVYDRDGIFDQQSFSLTDGAQPTRRWPLCFTPVPDEWKPACLWAWNKSMGIADGSEGRSANERGDEQAYIRQVVSRNGNPAMTFLYYPFDMEPVNPDSVMPRVWQAPTKGLYVFRNGWSGKQDIVAQVFLKSEGEGGWRNNDAGSIRLNGLGHAWTVRGKGVGKTRERHSETVVTLPEDDINEGMRAILKDINTQVDGSGSLLADMDLIYASQKTITDSKGRTRGAPLVDNRFKLLKQNLKDTGITGTRSFLADYSEKADCKAVFVIYDRIEGGKTKVWNWQLPEAVSRDQVSFHEDGFSIRQEGGVLRATFIQPQSIDIGLSDQMQSKVPAKDRATKEEKYKLHAIQVTAKPDAKLGQFLVVMTLDQTKQPTVQSMSSTDQGKHVINIGKQQIEVDTKSGKLTARH